MSIISHYFSKENDLLASNRKTIRFVIRGKEFEMVTDKGVFSKAGLDYGSRVLLDNIELSSDLTVLDLGCGYGPIGIVVAQLFSAKVVMADINNRAVQLAQENAINNQVNISVVQSDGFANIHDIFDVILLNPPIRTGKRIIYGMFESAKNHLKPGGKLIIVINKNQGAETALVFLRSIYANVDMIAKKSGYYVICCQISLTV
ncbi:MAG: methyltransferase [Candidatus Izemoplasmatales bacterium]